VYSADACIRRREHRPDDHVPRILGLVQRFVLKHWDLLIEILSEQGFPSDIESVDIVAEKHGPEYHPARVKVRARGANTCFAVNVAVSDRGRTRLAGEFAAVKSLHEKFRTDFVPKAYCLDQERVGHADRDDTSALMVLGEWFDGYNEFHLSVDESHGSTGIALWTQSEDIVFCPLENRG